MDVSAEGVDLDPPIGVAPCLLDTDRTQPSVIILKKIYNYWSNRCEKWPMKFKEKEMILRRRDNKTAITHSF